MVKQRAWGTCKSDSRHPERLINCEGKSVKFHRHFSSVKKDTVRREAWIRAYCRGNIFGCTKHFYICGFTLLVTMDRRKNILALMLCTRQALVYHTLPAVYKVIKNISKRPNERDVLKLFAYICALKIVDLRSQYHE